jgi:cytochrome c oxidase subunit 2
LAGGGGVSSADAGKQLFEQLRCNTCHLGGGQLGRGPSLEGLFGSTVKLQNGQTVVADENYIRESILRPAAKVVVGYQPIMPAFEGQIGEEGILQLIAEIKSMGHADAQPKTREPGDAKAGPATDEGTSSKSGKSPGGGKAAPGEPDSDRPQPEGENIRRETSGGGTTRKTEPKP